MYEGRRFQQVAVRAIIADIKAFADDTKRYDSARTSKSMGSASQWGQGKLIELFISTTLPKSIYSDPLTLDH